MNSEQIKAIKRYGKAIDAQARAFVRNDDVALIKAQADVEKQIANLKKLKIKKIQADMFLVSIDD